VIKRLLLFCFLAAALGWGAYAFMSIIAFSNETSFLTYFGEEDGKIIAIHHPKDFNLQDIPIDANQKNIAIIAALQNKFKELNTAYLSKNRSLLVITIRDKWNFNRVRQFFENGIYSFEKTGTTTFNFGKYRGKFNSKELLLFDYSIDLESNKIPAIEIDDQCSYSIIHVDSPPWEVDNYYVKPQGIISYRSQLTSNTNLSLVDDLNLFGPYLPEKITHYEFYEKNYLLFTDPLYAKSPLKQVMKTGGVFLMFNDAPIFLFDMESSDELSMFLNEYYHMTEENKDRTRFSNLRVCTAFNERVGTEKLLAYSRDGIGYITTQENALDALLLEVDMRKTSSSKKMDIDVLNTLPRWCSYRKKSASSLESISWINHQFLLTRISMGAAEPKPRETENITNYFTMNPGAPVISFCALSGRGNVVMETEQELIGYKNGSFKWQKKHPSTLAYRPLRLTTSLLENDHILLYENESIQVIDRMGRELFAIIGTFYLEPIQTILNQQNVFGLAKNNELLFFSSETGKQIKRINFSHKIQDWKGLLVNGKHGVGIKTGDQVLFIDVNNGKKFRFNGKPEDFVGFTSSSAIFRGKKGMEIHGLKQSIEVQVPSYWKFGGEITTNGQVGTLFYDSNTVVFAVQGKIRWKTTTPLSEIDHIQSASNLIVLRDDLQNKLVLLNPNGTVLDQEERPSQGEFQATPFGISGCSITTLLNGFLIQYNF
jgi:hypothetical protein